MPGEQSHDEQEQMPDPVLTPEQVDALLSRVVVLRDSHEALREQLGEANDEIAAARSEAGGEIRRLRDHADRLKVANDQIGDLCDEVGIERDRLRDAIGALNYGTWNRVGNKFGDGTPIGDHILKTCYALAEMAKEGGEK